MRIIHIPSLLAVICCAGCIDKIILDVPYPDGYPVVIDGFISTENKKHLIRVSSSFDIESHSSFRTPLSVGSITLRDNHGLSVSLTEKGIGDYYTPYMEGIVGNVYTLRVELTDGRVYESYPDTLYPSGYIEKIYSAFRSEKINQQSSYSFDVYFDAITYGSHHNLVWKYDVFFLADIPCCTCISRLTKSLPVVSQDQTVSHNRFESVKIVRIPLDGWAFQKGVYADVFQQSVSRRAYEFWRIVSTQLTGTQSLFQPVIGKMPVNFIQLQGSPQPLFGIFGGSNVIEGFVAFVCQ